MLEQCFSIAILLHAWSFVIHKADSTQDGADIMSDETMLILVGWSLLPVAHPQGTGGETTLALLLIDPAVPLASNLRNLHKQFFVAT